MIYLKKDIKNGEIKKIIHFHSEENKNQKELFFNNKKNVRWLIFGFIAALLLGLGILCLIELNILMQDKMILANDYFNSTAGAAEPWLTRGKEAYAWHLIVSSDNGAGWFYGTIITWFIFVPFFVYFVGYWMINIKKQKVKKGKKQKNVIK